MRYIKRPIVIDAWPVHEVFGKSERDPLVQQAIDKGWVRATYRGGIFVDTQEGVMYGHPSDYLIRGIEGEFYVCKRSVFEASYDPTSPIMSSGSPDRVVLAIKYGEDTGPKRSEEDELRDRFPRE